MSDLETKNAIRLILLTASLGGMSYLSFNNGLLLSYFSPFGNSQRNYPDFIINPAVNNIFSHHSF